MEVDGDTIKNTAGELGRAVSFVFTPDPVRGEITTLRSAKMDEVNEIATSVAAIAEEQSASTEEDG